MRAEGGMASTTDQKPSTAPLYAVFLLCVCSGARALAAACCPLPRLGVARWLGLAAAALA